MQSKKKTERVEERERIWECRKEGLVDNGMREREKWDKGKGNGGKGGGRKKNEKKI